MKLATQIFKLMVIFQPMLLFAIVFNITILIRLISWFILIGSFIQFLSVLRYRKTFHEFNLILAVVIILIAFLSLFLGGLSYDGFIEYLKFVSMILIWIIYPYVNINKLKNICKISFLIQALLLVFFSQQQFAYEYIDDGVVRVSESLTLGFNNPNLTSMIVFYVLVAILSFNMDNNSFITKAFYAILLMFLYYLIVKTDCRTTMFMSVLLTASFFLINKTQFIAKLVSRKIITLLTLALPLLYCVLYVYLSNLPELRNVEFMGKPIFSGRQYLYVDLFSTLSENPIVGLCGKYKFANAHNGMLTILLNTGFLGLLFYLVYNYKNLRTISKGISRPNEVFYFIAIIAIFVNSCNEAAILVSANLFYVYFMCLLVMAGRDSIR